MTKKRIYLISSAAIIPVFLLVSGLKLLQGKDDNTHYGPTYNVNRGPLTISFVESGTIKARDQIILKCEVEGRTSITYVIPEGTRVKKDDLLVELDVSSLEDQRIDREIDVQKAEAAFISAKENFAVVQNQAKSDNDRADLKLAFARQDLEKYQKGEYQTELLKANTEITLAEEELSKAEDYLEWSEKLFAEKYIPETELKGDRLTKKKSELNLEIANNNKQLLQEYTYKRQLAQLISDVNQAEIELEITKRKSNASIIQAEAELKAKEAEYGRQKDKLDKVLDQISKTKIYAPADGLVIYAASAKTMSWRSNSEPLDVGREVSEREELIYLPTGEEADAEIMIHESYLKKITPGMPTMITVDALAGKRFYGTTKQIAPLPDSRSMWMNPDLKVYLTKVEMEGVDPMLRSGMSCQAEIVVQQLKEALYVPLQAVIRVGQEPTVFVRNGKTYQPRTVKTGLDNNKVIHIVEGLEDGDIVLLNPPLKSAAVYTKSEQDFGDGFQEKINSGLKKAESMGTTGGSENKPNAEMTQAEKMKKQLENLTPEQIEEMKKKYESMSPEEKENLKKQFSGQGLEEQKAQENQ
ncbi:MAG: Macrolide export protein MacA [Planctomycetes bacterium ADurb.Bin401]|nr:MAG: Macrolide export protein MacA [Planctomycetes bacterium ADurb.Bin401]